MKRRTVGYLLIAFELSLVLFFLYFYLYKDPFTTVIEIAVTGLIVSIYSISIIFYLKHFNIVRKENRKESYSTDAFKNENSYSSIPKGKYVKVCPNCGSTNVSYESYKSMASDFCKDCGYGSLKSPGHFDGVLKIFPEVEGTGERTLRNIKAREKGTKETK
jgi:predicted RNA-binding Zn-ribbon protein involved in translation (DUF1610 family)